MTHIRIDLLQEKPEIKVVANIDAALPARADVVQYGFAADHDPQESFFDVNQMLSVLETLCTNMRDFFPGATKAELTSTLQALLDTYGQNATFDENIRRISSLSGVFMKDVFDYASHYYGGLRIAGPELSRWMLAATASRAEHDRGRINSTNHILSDIADVIERACKLPLR